MKKLLPDFKKILSLFLIWRIFLLTIESFASKIFPLQLGYLGLGPWANFDGVHYLAIARYGYGLFQQAFFPLYPLLIRILAEISTWQSYLISLIISQIGFGIGLFFFYRLSQNWWPVILWLLFPTSFFFAATYTEGLFLGLVIATFYAAEKNKWWLVGTLGGLASLTRLFGVFLFPAFLFGYWTRFKTYKQRNQLYWLGLIPAGLAFYMLYLQQTLGDPLAFFHVQPAFGAGRSGNNFTLLPQVVWRYFKIFISINPTTWNFRVAIFEFLTLLLALILFWQGFRQKLNKAQLIYAAMIVIVPTLTGTLSSFPRYLLSAFPLFFVLGNLHNRWIKLIIAFIFGSGLILTTSAFLRGYFVS